MKAIILAAGRGTRMMPYTKDRPKPLLKVDSKNTILDIQIQKLQKTPIDEIVIVGGYLQPLIEKKIKKDYPNLDIKVLYNPFFDVSNNFVSLWFARHNMDESFIVINGDDVFQSGIVNGLIKKTKGKEVVMVIDTKDSYDEDDMKIRLRSNKIIEVNKEIPLDKAEGESIGMIKFERKGIIKLKKIMDDMIKKDENRNVFWLKSIQEMIKKYNNVDYYKVSQDQWEEIDFHKEYLELRNKRYKKYYFEREYDKKLARVGKNKFNSLFIIKNSRKLFRKLLNNIFNRRE